MRLAEQAVRKLESGCDDNDWPMTFPEIAAWLAEKHEIVAEYVDFDRWTTGWKFPDGSVTDEEIRHHWWDVDDMYADMSAETDDGIREI